MMFLMALVALDSLLAVFDESDGLLPDCEVMGSERGDWHAVFDLVRDRGWRAVWHSDHGDVPLPPDTAEVLRHVNAVAVWPAPGLHVSLFPGEDVSFDFDRRELRDQAAADALCELISAVGQTLRKPVVACYEGSSCRAFLRYDPDREAFSLEGPGGQAPAVGPARAAGLPEFVFDGASFDDLAGFFAAIARTLGVSGWGSNLDAFNDILRGGFGTPEGGFVLRWVRADESARRLGWPETIRYLEKKLTTCHPANVDSVEADLQAARRGEGQTLFEIIIGIIGAHGPEGTESEDNVHLILA